MKKLICLLSVLMLSLTLLAGCGKTEATKNAEALIKAIGDVDADSEKAVNAAREAYNALSDEEKEKVKNTDTLEKAEAALTDIVTVNEDIAAIADAAVSGYISEDVKISDLLTRAKEIKENYENMSDSRKEQVENIEGIDDSIAKLESYVSNAEKAAAQYVKAFLQVNADTAPEVTAVYCIKQIRNDTDEYHFFALTYKTAGGEEKTVYAHARCTEAVAAQAIAERADTFFVDEPATQSADAKTNGNVTLNLESVLALANS